MARLLAFNAIFFLLPFAVYAAWLAFTRGSLSNIADWQAKTVAYLAIGGALLMVVALVVFTTFQVFPPGGTYTPARVEDGKIVPGHFD